MHSNRRRIGALIFLSYRNILVDRYEPGFAVHFKAAEIEPGQEPGSGDRLALIIIRVPVDSPDCIDYVFHVTGYDNFYVRFPKLHHFEHIPDIFQRILPVCDDRIEIHLIEKVNGFFRACAREKGQVPVSVRALFQCVDVIFLSDDENIQGPAPFIPAFYPELTSIIPS